MFDSFVKYVYICNISNISKIFLQRRNTVLKRAFVIASSIGVIYALQ